MEKSYIKVVGILVDNIVGKFSHIFGKVDKQKNMVLICSYAEFDILVGHVFNEITLNMTGIESIACRIILKKVSQEFLKEYDMIPKGHKTICMFEFLDGKIPEIIFELPIIEGWHQMTEKHLYFR